MSSYIRLKQLFLLCAILLLSACASQKGGTGDIYELRRLQGGAIDIVGTDKVNGLRYTGLKETAMTVGAQSGLAWRSKHINQVLMRHEKELSQVYDFSAMLLDHNVLPPVLLQGRTSLNQGSQDTLRLADRIYKIHSQARFVTTPPHWREFLWMDYSKPEIPNRTLLPKNRHEKAIWDEYVTKGWEEGIEQADHIFHDNLARLTQDYRGMVLYRTLLAQNMVSKPFVARSELGVTGDSSEMRINDQVLRITALPGLQTDSSQWKPAVSMPPEHEPRPQPRFHEPTRHQPISITPEPPPKWKSAVDKS